MSTSIKAVAMPTSMALGVGTTVAILAAATATTTIATVAFAVLGTVLAAFSIASVTAWIDPTSTNAGKYFSNMGGHMSWILLGIIHLVGQTLLQSLIAGLGDLVRNSIGGGQRVTVVHK